MMLSLQEAADLARVNKSTLFRALKAGKISGTRDEHGQWRIDPAEVSRVYTIAVGDAEQQHASPRKRDRTDELVAVLRGQLDHMTGELQRMQRDAETWRNAFETERAQRLALAAPQPDTEGGNEVGNRWRRTWRWLRSTG